MRTKILRNIFISLSAIFVLAITAHAQNLYVTVLRPFEILEYTPSGVQSTFDSGQRPPGLSAPRGLDFDSIGNLFAAETVLPPDHTADGIGRVLKFNLNNQVSTFGTVRVSEVDIFLEELATDVAGNVYVLANASNDPTTPGTIFEFTPDGERIVFGSVPGVPDNITANFGLAFDSTGNL